MISVLICIFISSHLNEFNCVVSSYQSGSDSHFLLLESHDATHDDDRDGDDHISVRTGEEPSSYLNLLILSLDGRHEYHDVHQLRFQRAGCESKMREIEKQNPVKLSDAGEVTGVSRTSRKRGNMNLVIPSSSHIITTTSQRSKKITHGYYFPPVLKLHSTHQKSSLRRGVSHSLIDFSFSFFPLHS